MRGCVSEAKQARQRVSMVPQSSRAGVACAVLVISFFFFFSFLFGQAVILLFEQMCVQAGWCMCEC